MLSSRINAFHQLIIFTLYLTAASICTHLYFDQRAETLWKSTALLISNNAERPFIYRVFSPLVLSQLSENIPEKYKKRLVASKRGEPRKLDGIKHYQWPEKSPHIFLISYYWVFMFLIITAYTWRLLLHKTQNLTTFGLDIAPAIGILALPHLFMKSGFIYDIPELFFFSAGLLLYLKKQWKLYYICFALAVLNKETGILMGAWILLPLTNKQWRFSIQHASLHTLIGIPILVAIRLHYADRDGSIAEFHLWRNIDFFFSLEPWLKFGNAYAFHLPTTRSFNIINLIIFGGPLILFWKKLNKDLRWQFSTLLTILLPLYIAFGFKDEIRVFLPVIPSYFLLYTEAMRYFYQRLETSPQNQS